MRISPFLCISLILFALFSTAFSQGDDQDAQFDETVQVEDGEMPSHPQNQKLSEDQINSMRTKTMSCILLTKHKIYALQKELGAVLEMFSSKQSEQNALYRKIFSEMLETCYVHITDQDGLKFMDEVQKKDFNVNNFDHIIETFSLEKFRGNAKTVSTELNQIQKQLFKYAEEFDKVMKEKQEKEEEEQEKEKEKLTPDDYEPKIAGLSLKNSPDVVKYGYIVAIFAVFGVIIYWGVKSVFTGSVLVGDKVKKEKKKNKKQN